MLNNYQGEQKTDGITFYRFEIWSVVYIENQILLIATQFACLPDHLTRDIKSNYLRKILR